MITENFQGEIDYLNEYLETEYSISKEDYKEILDAMTRMKNSMDEKEIMDKHYNGQSADSEGR